MEKIFNINFTMTPNCKIFGNVGLTRHMIGQAEICNEVLDILKTTGKRMRVMDIQSYAMGQPSLYPETAESTNQKISAMLKKLCSIDMVKKTRENTGRKVTACKIDYRLKKVPFEVDEILTWFELA